MATAPTLYREIDALGGEPQSASEYDRIWNDGYSAALTAALAILERRGFTEAGDAVALPISEAPRDGTQILVPVGHGLADVVAWWDGGWRESANGLRLRNEPAVFMHLPDVLTKQVQP